MSTDTHDMNRLFRILWLFAIVWVCSLTACLPKSYDLVIEARDRDLIEPGLYTVEYALLPADSDRAHTDINVVIDVLDQNDESVDVVQESFIVRAGHTYRVTISVLSETTGTLITKKTMTVTAVDQRRLDVLNPPDRRVYAEGERFDPAGMIIASVGSDGTSTIIEDYVYDTAPLTVDDSVFSISYQDMETDIILNITPNTVEFVLDFGGIRDPMTLMLPFLSDMPLISIPGTRVLNLYESPDLTGAPIDFPYVPTHTGIVMLYAEIDAAVHTVTFNVPEGFDRIGGGPLEQFVVHGQPLENPPVLDKDGFLTIAWSEDLRAIEHDLDLFLSYAGIVVTEQPDTMGSVTSYLIDVVSSGLTVEINLRVEKWGYDYVEHDPETTYLIECDTVISARVLYEDEWIDLDDIRIDTDDRAGLSKPSVSYYADTETPGHLLVILHRGETTYGEDDRISHTAYRLDQSDPWHVFTGPEHVLSVQNGTTIEMETFDQDGRPSVRLTVSAELASVSYEVFGKTTARYVLRMTEHFPNGIRTVHTQLIGAIEHVAGTVNYGVFRSFYPYRTGSAYIGCGPKAAEIFLGWFGSEKTQVELVEEGYIDTESVRFFRSIFTTPKQMTDGIARVLHEYGFDDYAVSNDSTPKTDQTVGLIESYLQNGFPVVILVDEGEHYQVISASIVTWSSAGTVMNASFDVHDNGGKRVRTWSGIGYFFENRWHAVTARAAGYPSYRDMILSLEIRKEE